MKTALISVYDKTGIEGFARFLIDFGFQIISSGGTFRHLQNHGVKAHEVSEYTGSPEIMGGRVKTIHPKIAGGILSRRTVGDAHDLLSIGASDIDIVVVNLYPFEEVVKRPGVSHEEVMENIDIGGPTMIRAAAKNHLNVIVVVDPADYILVMNEWPGGVSVNDRSYLAKKVFERMARYEAAIAEYMSRKDNDGLPFY